MKPIPPTREDRARGAARLARDGKPALAPIDQLVAVAGVTKIAIVRWINEGKSRVYLDAVECPVRGWCSTAAAIRRFKREVAEKRGELTPAAEG